MQEYEEQDRLYKCNKDLIATFSTMSVRQYLERDFIKNPFSDIKVEDLEILALEVETKTATEEGLVIVITLLDMMSIAL